MTTKRGRPRRAGADEEILRVALQLLREKGYRALTVDAVAERAGVAKTTLYRRWPAKGALIAAAIEPLAPSSGAADLPAALRDATALFSLIHDVDDVEVLRAVVRSQRHRIREHLDSDLSADMIIGALVARLLS